MHEVQSLVLLNPWLLLPPCLQSTPPLQAQVLALLQEWAYTLKPAQFSNAYSQLQVGMAVAAGRGLCTGMEDEGMRVPALVFGKPEAAAPLACSASLAGKLVGGQGRPDGERRKGCGWIQPRVRLR